MIKTVLNDEGCNIILQLYAHGEDERRQLLAIFDIVRLFNQTQEKIEKDAMLATLYPSPKKEDTPLGSCKTGVKEP